MTWIRQLHPLMLVAAATAAVAEALNTAIEEIVDLVTPEWSLPTKHARDPRIIRCFLCALSEWNFCAFCDLNNFELELI